MKFTDIFKFKKPELTDTYSIEHQNENWDIVEEELTDKRDKDTYKIIADYFSDITEDTDIRKVIHRLDSGQYTYNVEIDGNLIVPDVGCVDTQIHWERQIQPNGYIYGLLTVEGMYGEKRKIKQCSIYNVQKYTDWYEITLARKSSGLEHTLDVDCNTLLEERDYIVGTSILNATSNSAVNLPYEAGYFALLVHATMNDISNGCVQIAINRDSGNIYVRTYVDKIWSSWKKQFTINGGTIATNNGVPLILKNTESGAETSVVGFQNENGNLGHLGFTGVDNPVFISADKSSVKKIVTEDTLVVVENTVSVTIPEDVTIGTITVPYPEGFTKANCMVLNVMGKYLGYNNLGEYDEFILTGSEATIQLKDNGVIIKFIYDPGTHNVSYRVALYQFK